MKRFDVLATCAVIGCALLSGCQSDQSRPVTYRIDGHTFTNPDSAVDEASRQDGVFLSQVTPASQRLGGRAVVVLPGPASLRAALTSTSLVKAEVVDTFVKLNDVHVVTDGEAIERGHIFDSVAILRSDDPGNVDIGTADYKIWLDRFGGGPIHWTLVTRAGLSHEIVPSSASVGRVVWLNSLNVAVLNAAADLGASVTRQALPERATGGLLIGTAFFIDAGGHALTNAHMVSGCKNVQLSVEDGDVADARVVASDPQNDLALIAIAHVSPNHARFSAAPPRQGDPVVVYGFPLAGALSTQGNLTTGIVSALVGLKDDSRMLQISAPVQVGNSGGPLLDAAGDVIGVVTAKMNALRVAAATGDIPQNVNFAIKASIIENFLSSNGVGFEDGAAGKALPIADVGERARGFTHKLTCRR